MTENIFHRVNVNNYTSSNGRKGTKALILDAGELKGYFFSRDSNVLLFNLSVALVPWNIVNCLHKVFIFSLLFPKAC